MRSVIPFNKVWSVCMALILLKISEPDNVLGTVFLLTSSVVFSCSFQVELRDILVSLFKAAALSLVPAVSYLWCCFIHNELYSYQLSSLSLLSQTAWESGNEKQGVCEKKKQPQKNHVQTHATSVLRFSSRPKSSL